MPIGHIDPLVDQVIMAQLSPDFTFWTRVKLALSWAIAPITFVVIGRTLRITVRRKPR